MFVLHLFTCVRRDFTIRHNHHQGDHRHFSIYRRCRSIGRQRLPINHHNRQIHHLLTTTGMPSPIVWFMILRKLILIQKL
ncbi:hypothetical protein HanXRQr2_Chr14g0668431 [Helianthus annuus]|uniref:Uncharacterized protein n=1 Tax=Helianthus annuus TaxID=4232 RepID=A0A251SMT8_HELAN|nr:hypothetical protein HanXRQr2_Chr14g0668431 [Helianthus annuus]